MDLFRVFWLLLVSGVTLAGLGLHGCATANHHNHEVVTDASNSPGEVVAEKQALTGCKAEPVIRKTPTGVSFVRTPEECFKDLPDFPYPGKYVEIDGLRQAYVEDGPIDGKVVLLLHGQPSWSYLYRKMIPVLAKAGYRVIAMDHLGMGRSDKPTSIKDYSYLRHIGRLEAFIKKLGLKDITLFCQDWGSLIGLHVAGKHPDWFARIVVGNGSLPVIPAGVKPFPPVKNPDEIDDSLKSPFSNIPAQQPGFYDKDGKRKFPSDPAGFGKWMAFAMKSPKFRPSEVVEALTWFDLPDKEAAAYDAPFPSRIYMAGIRVFPSLINELGGANQKSWEGLKAYKKPFLTIWASNDPGSMGDQKAQDYLTQNIPGAKGLPHTRLPKSSHFLQDDQGSEIARRIAALIKQHSMVGGDFRNQRYCEVLLVFVKNQKLEAQVWNSYGLGDCPDAAWKALDTEKIKAETKALRVILNGPRHWMMNKITGQQKERKIMKFGDIPMLLSAILEVQPSGGPAKPYTGNTVNRTTAFTFHAGETVFQLISPNKETYTMQSYSLQKDPSLNIENLPSLASKLKLPEGWSYKAVKLDAALVLEATGIATVIQDDLGNTYQKNNTP